MRIISPKPMASLVPGDTVLVEPEPGEPPGTLEFTMWKAGDILDPAAEVPTPLAANETRAAFRARIRAGIAAYQASLTADPPARVRLDITAEV